MVAAAVAWIRQARPNLTADQVYQTIRLSAAQVGQPGWEPDTGFGLLSVESALQFSPPPPDPLEPNDEPVFVDGRAFGKPAPFFYKGRGKKRLVGFLDTFEDFADIYRIRLRAHSRVKVVANPAGNDDVAVYAFPKKAKRLIRKRAIKKASHRKRGRTEHFVLRNRAGKRKIFYIALEVQPGTRDLDAAYALRVG
jgi:hypothetical protein